MTKRQIRVAMAVLAVLALLSAAVSGCGGAPTGTVAPSTAGKTATSVRATTTAVPTAPSTTAPTTTAAATMAAPTPAYTGIPSVGTVYRLVEVRDYVMDNTASPPMPGPERTTDAYAAFLDGLAAAVLATGHSSTIGEFSVTVSFTGPNGPGVTARDPLTTTTGYTWAVPDTLTAGTPATLTATGSQHVVATSGADTWAAGELYFSLYGGEESTFEMDFRGDGEGLVNIDAAFGSALPALTAGQTVSHGEYPMSIPAGPSRTLAIEVMMMPFDGNRSLHRVYFYQP